MPELYVEEEEATTQMSETTPNKTIKPSKSN